MTAEKLQILEDLVEDLLQEIDLNDPVVETDDGDVLVLPARILVVLGQIDDLMHGSRKW
jgi:hypothetical protein